MNKFLSGMGMGMAMGAFAGMAAACMMSEADRRCMKRKAKKAVRAVEDTMAGLGM